MLIGQRRVGKSYLLFQTMDGIKEKFPKANIIYINLELNEFEAITDHKGLYDYIKLKSKAGEMNFLLIDEIQVIPEFEKTIRSLLAEGGYDIYCTGSNAQLLSGELGTFLGGRYIEIPVQALNYNEFIDFHKLAHSDDSLDKYLKFGGLPYLIHLDLNDDTVFDYLKNINQSILFRDVVSRFEVRNVVFLHLKTIGYSVLIGKQNQREVDFIAERNTEKIYFQVALRITEDQTMTREFGNLMAIQDNYPKYVITLDDFTGSSHEGIKHIPLKQFLYEFK